MLRNINRLASSGTERMAREILEKLIEAGEAPWNGKIPFFSFINNFEDIVEHFTEALDEALQGNDDQLNACERLILIDAIAQYFY